MARRRMRSTSRISRRRLLQLGALTGTAAATTGALGGLSRAAASTGSSAGGSGTDGPAFADGASKLPAERAQVQSFEGPHQLAVLSEPTRATTVVAFDVIAGSRSELRDLLRTMTSRARLLYAGGTPQFDRPRGADRRQRHSRAGGAAPVGGFCRRAGGQPVR